jgi:hypothetical protein
MIRGLRHQCTSEDMRQALPGGGTSTRTKGCNETSNLACLQPIDRSPSTNEALAANALQYLRTPVHEQSMPKFHIQQLMLHAIVQTAIASFESTSLEIFAQDGYMIDECGQPRAKTFVYGESLQYRIRHHTSSFRTALGHAWVRTTTIYPTDNATAGRFQTVTSFVFYPTVWLKFLGFQRGLEAVVSSAGQSWILNCRITVTNALPEDSLIFDLCRTGQTRAVQTLFDKGLASVVDTSPKGWKPLHVRALILDLSLLNIDALRLMMILVRCRRGTCRAVHNADPNRSRQVSISLRRTFRVYLVSLV